ncbi:hypothetical protein JCM6882_002036 [Rhodosporidiobolus microsporus]
MAVRPGLFGGPAGAPRSEEGKQAVFVQFKQLCVPLLEAARSPSGAPAARTAVQLLGKLCSLLADTPSSAFSPALANYVFFPLSSLLQPRSDGSDRGDRVLEATMLVLASLVPKWRAAGMEQRVRQELWIMTALTLGGPLDTTRPPGKGAEKGKGKAVERTEETKLAMVKVLLALMERDEPVEEQQQAEDDDDPLGERIDWSAPDPTSAFTPPKPASFAPPPVPILFHTLTTLLSLAAEPTSLLQLQLSSLAALRTLLFDYLARTAPSPSVPAVEPGSGPSPLLATALPGTASTLSRIALSKAKSSAEAETSTRRQASAVVVEAVRVLSRLVAEAVGDRVTVALRDTRSGADDDAALSATLEELVELRLADDPPAEEEDDSSPPAPPDPPPAPPSGPTLPTPSWLRYTVTSISTLLSALSPLSTHESPLVRAALVALLDDVVRCCAPTLGEHLEVPLEGLLSLASDAWEDVSAPARRALLAAFSLPAAETAHHPLALASKIVQRRLAALPRSIRRQDEHAVQRGAGIVRAALELLPTVQTANGASQGVLQGVEKWSWGLLAALELERIPAAGRAAEGGMTLAWITSSSQDEAAGGGTTAFPPLRLRAVDEQATLESLEGLWTSLGRAAAAAGQEGEVVDLFLGVALGPRREETVATSALWVLDGVLGGLRGGKVEKAQKKVLRRAVKAVLSLLEELEAVDDEDDSPPPPSSSSKTDLLSAGEADSPAVALIERKKGVVETPSLDKYNPAVALATSREARASHALLLVSLSLRLLSTLATLLSSSFQPFLMQSLYHVLAHLSPTTHPYLRAHAQHALFLVSDATSYASPQNLVLSNVDYVVNSVSQRLSVSRLEPNAPLVLVEMIRLVGKPIVPMVQDLVDDVFEALDDYHGYEEVTVGLWAVLDALLKVMEEDLPEKKAQRETDVVRANASADWRAFEDWLAHRHDRPAREADDDVEEINPQRPFDSGFADAASNDPTRADEPTSFPEDEKKVVPPTRPQVVTAQILSKAAYFLSHPSPFLRARVLSLTASAVPLLSRPSLDAADPKATRASDLLPIIHRAWPFILNRFNDAEAYVVVEAAALIESLATHVGEFMSRRILDDVWPRFRTLFAKQQKEDQQSALFPSSSSGASSTRYSTSHRLHRSILRTLVHVARDVPLKEAVLWDQVVLLRRFLAVKNVEPELQVAALDLYGALGEINPDAVWLALAATVGAEEGLPRYLRMEGIEFGTNIERLLQKL